MTENGRPKCESGTEMKNENCKCVNEIVPYSYQNLVKCMFLPLKSSENVKTKEIRQ